MKSYKLLVLCFFATAFSACTKQPEVCDGKHGYKANSDLASISSDGEFVSSAYQLVLQRPADEEGLKLHCGLLHDGKVDRIGLIISFAASDEAKSLHVTP